MTDRRINHFTFPIRPDQTRATLRAQIKNGILWLEMGFQYRKIVLEVQPQTESVIEDGQLEFPAHAGKAIHWGRLQFALYDASA